MKSLSLLLAFLLIGFLSIAQKLKIQLEYNGLPFTLNKKISYQDDSIQFSQLKFYLSNLQFDHTNIAVENYHLIDANKKESLVIPMPDLQRNIEHIEFTLGIDSTKNVSGVFGGDLDPTNGMYWTWQSGYINIKIEGSSPLSQSRKNKFQFHLGGYAFPFKTSRVLHYSINKNGEDYILHFDLGLFFQEVDLRELNQIMSPSKKAVKLVDLFENCFYTNE